MHPCGASNSSKQSRLICLLSQHRGRCAGTPQQHTPVATPPEPTIPEALLPAPGPLSTRLLAQASQPAGVLHASGLTSGNFYSRTL